MDIAAYLQRKNIPFQLVHHSPAFTAQELAASEHVPGNRVAKTVVVKVDGDFKLLVLPASFNVRLDRLREALEAEEVSLADESELSELFPDCELGAMPPMGREYDIDVIADEHLAESDEIIFQSGRHDEAVRIRWRDFERLENPRLASFAEHLH